MSARQFRGLRGTSMRSPPLTGGRRSRAVEGSSRWIPTGSRVAAAETAGGQQPPEPPDGRWAAWRSSPSSMEAMSPSAGIPFCLGMPASCTPRHSTRRRSHGVGGVLACAFPKCRAARRARPSSRLDATRRRRRRPLDKRRSRVNEPVLVVGMGVETRTWSSEALGREMGKKRTKEIIAAP